MTHHVAHCEKMNASASMSLRQELMILLWTRFLPKLEDPPMPQLLLAYEIREMDNELYDDITLSFSQLLKWVYNLLILAVTLRASYYCVEFYMTKYHCRILKEKN